MTTPLQENRGTGERLEKCWMRYKWLIIGSLVVLLILVAVLTPYLNRESADYRVLIYVDKLLPEGTAEALAEELARYGVDLNGDGEVEVEAIDVSVGPGDITGQAETALEVKRTSDLQSKDVALLVCNQNTLEYYEQAGIVDADPDGRFNWNSTQLQGKREEFVYIGVDVYFVLKSVPEDEASQRRRREAEQLLRSIREANEKNSVR